MFWELLLCLPLKNVTLVLWDAVPELALAFVEVIDGREVQVLLMPAEKSFPGANVTVGGVNTSNFCLHRVGQQRVKVSQIPGTSLFIHKSVQEISSIEWRGVNYILPELNK